MQMLIVFQLMSHLCEHLRAFIIINLSKSLGPSVLYSIEVRSVMLLLSNLTAIPTFSYSVSKSLSGCMSALNAVRSLGSVSGVP